MPLFMLEIGLSEWWNDLVEEFVFNFIEDDRWKYITNGLKVTLTVTFFALILGSVLGVITAMIRTTWEKNNKDMYPGVAKSVLSVLNTITEVYVTVIRGTPVVVQLLIGYFVILVSTTNTVLVASLVFGFNSGAYISEIIRGGIMSIDPGQFEAGRSLGFNYVSTMRYIVIPQAFKIVLPSLGNECIALLKETAVCGYIGLMDLTKGGDVIRGRTFSAFMPLIAVALIYLVIVLILSYLIGILERSLRKNERRQE